MSLINTKIMNWRIADSRLSDYNYQRTLAGALDAFKVNSESPYGIITPQLKEKAFGSVGKVVQIPVFEWDKEVQVSNTRSCVIPDSENTSKFYNVVFKTYSVGFSMLPSAHYSNAVTYEADWRRKMEKVALGLRKALDKDAVNALTLGQTKVVNNPLGYATGGAFSVETTEDKGGRLMLDIPALMQGNGYEGDVDIVCNSGVTAINNRAAVNYYNLPENKDRHFISTNMPNTSQAELFAVERGSIGLLTRVDQESLVGAEANGHRWEVVEMPFLNMLVGSHHYKAVGDFSNAGGSECGIKEHFGFSVDVAFVTPYISDAETQATPILGAAVK